MPSNRKIVFRNGEIYHIFNRSIERKPIFIYKRDSFRAKDIAKYYQYKETPLRFSKLIQQPREVREKILVKLYKSEKNVEMLAYCFMPNHFHFLLKQNSNKGISVFASNFTNSYTKFFNTKYNRAGPLMQGVFKAVHIENDEQLMHVSRYIHLNPVVHSLVDINELSNYPLSSYPEYQTSSGENITNPNLILGMFSSVSAYDTFVRNQKDYGKKLEAIKHLTLD